MLDEAVSGLDVAAQDQILRLRLLAAIRAETGVSYVCIAHDLAVVRQVADHLIVLRRGRLVEAGAAAQVLDAPPPPLHAAAARLGPRAGWTPPAPPPPR